MSIASNLEQIKSTLPPNVKLIAVSKFHPAEDIMEAYNAGQRIFGESKMQEIDSKQAILPKDIEWHFIGHLQTNKVKYIVPYTHTIHSVDSWKLLSEIEKQASLVNRTVKCLLEIHIASEESKYGLSFDACRQLLSENDWASLKHIQISGVMGMATYTDNTELIKSEFKALKLFFLELKQSFFKDFEYFSEISMGMSQDYTIGVDEGSTMVRIGSAIFGERI